MIKATHTLQVQDLEKPLQHLWKLSGDKIERIRREYPENLGSPVFTVKGKYTTRGWTEWTQGFQYGSAILQFDATGEEGFLEYGRKETVDKMAPHVSHFGVHDHGFNNVSTYGNLRRLMRDKKIAFNEWELNFYEIALKTSGAVQARRWTSLPDNLGYIYSFNGPHSLFVDTLRTLRALSMGHLLGHAYMGEHDEKISLWKRAVQHAITTAKYSIFYGEGRDSYDVRGRTAHEAVFNTNDGHFRCPNAQQGYTGFSTWTRGLAWAMCGYPEQLEFLETLPEEDFAEVGGKAHVREIFLKAATAVCDFYIEHTPTCGIPYWDTGAPNLHRLGDYLNRPADPYNEWEPVDSTAAAIGSQGLLRLGRYLQAQGKKAEGDRYWQAGLHVVNTLLQSPYLSEQEEHQGLLLHSIYHRPNGWDYTPDNQKVPCGESSMWGDYHLREVALYLQRMIRKETEYTFFA